MKNIIDFIKSLVTEIKKDDLISVANDLTYKLFFSLFPFIIFLMSLISFLELDSAHFVDQLSYILSADILSPIKVFIKEIAEVRSSALLSFSLLVSVYGASLGFGTVVKGINKAYGIKDTRNFFAKTSIRIIMVIILAVIIVISLFLGIFGDYILQFLKNKFDLTLFVLFLFELLRYIISISILFFSVILINKLAAAKKTSFKSLFRGSALTVTVWIAVSAGFNFYIENFARYSNVYGSIAGIMVLMLWINIMCVILLVGTEINALLEKTIESLKTAESVSAIELDR